jgi:hypothetical protein
LKPARATFGFLRAIGVAVLLLGAVALGEQGPVLPGLDSLPETPEITTPRTRKSPLAQPGWRGARGTPLVTEGAPAPSETNEESQEDWRAARSETSESADKPTAPVNNRQKLRKEGAPGLRDEKPARQDRMTPQRQAPETKRNPSGAALAVPRQRREPSDGRAMQRGLQSNPAAQQRAGIDLKRETPRSPQAGMGYPSGAQGPQTRRTDRAPAKSPPANGGKPAARREKQPGRWPAR